MLNRESTQVIYYSPKEKTALSLLLLGLFHPRISPKKKKFKKFLAPFWKLIGNISVACSGQERVLFTGGANLSEMDPILSVWPGGLQRRLRA